MNIVMLIGNLGADAELRSFEGGGQVCSFRMATSRKYKNPAGELITKTEWHRCSLWGTRGAAVCQYLTKGKKVAVTGEIRYREHEKEGQRYWTTEIHVQELEFVGGGNGTGGGGGGGSGNDDMGEMPF